MSSSKSKKQPSVTPKVQAETQGPLAWPFYLFFGFIILFIPVFHQKTALDITLFPRLTAVCTFFAICSLWLMAKPSFLSNERNILRNPVFGILIAYLGILIVTMVFARHYQEGFFDLFKNTLFLTTIALGAMLFAHKPDWHEKIPWLVMIASVIALAIGAKQYFEKVLLTSGRQLKDGREDIYAVDGIMSHKNEYSNALMLMLPFLLYAVYRLKGPWRAVAVIITSLQITMILLLKTRAVWLGIMTLGLIASISVVLFAGRMGIEKKWRNGIAALLVTGIATILFVFNMPRASDDFSIVGRIQSITDTQSWHNINRLKIWSATLDMIQDNLWLGVGPGNWNIEYYPYVQGVFTGIEQTNWGRPHNDFLWVFAEKGIFGILLFLSFFAYLFYLGIQVVRKATDKNSRILAILLMGGIASYLCISMFSFPIERINHTLYLALMAAGLIALHHSLTDRPSGSRHSAFVFLPLAALLSIGSYYGFQAVDMEQHLKAARAAREKKMYDVMLHEAKEAKNPFRLLDNNSSPADEFIASALFHQGKYEEALTAINQGLEVFPYHIVMLGRKGEILVSLKRYKEAEAVFVEGLKLVPNSRELLYNRGVCFYYQGMYSEALASMEKIKKGRRGKEIGEKIRFLKKVVKSEKETGKKLPPPPQQ